MTDWVWVPFSVDSQYDGMRVDRFLSQRLAAYSRSRVQGMLVDARIVRDNRPLKPSAKVRGGERIMIAYPRRMEPPLSDDLTLPILYEDDHLIVINKPANMLSHPTDKILNNTVLAVLRKVRPDLSRVHLLHRLDRDTSGVLALGKTVKAARLWSEQMERREIHKRYLALVRGIPKMSRGLIESPIGREGGEIKVRQWINVPGAVSARTRYEMVRKWGEGALIEANPETGRLHQIRVHLASIGHPILGDTLYQGAGEVYLKMTRGEVSPEDRVPLGFHRLALHAAALEFSHPLTGKPLRLCAPLPDDLRDFLTARGVGKIDTLCSR
jgi:23S rRNA pseudouridine1911/1915/1917 synthase